MWVRGVDSWADSGSGNRALSPFAVQPVWIEITVWAKYCPWCCVRYEEAHKIRCLTVTEWHVQGLTKRTQGHIHRWGVRKIGDSGTHGNKNWAGLRVGESGRQFKMVLRIWERYWRKRSQRRQLTLVNLRRTGSRFVVGVGWGGGRMDLLFLEDLEYLGI